MKRASETNVCVNMQKKDDRQLVIETQDMQSDADKTGALQACV
jgi:hypothetical protein